MRRPEVPRWACGKCDKPLRDGDLHTCPGLMGKVMRKLRGGIQIFDSPEEAKHFAEHSSLAREGD